MSQSSPINDFDAYKHEWDKGFSHQNASNKFSLNNVPDQSKKIPQLDFSSFTFIHYVCALCLMVFMLGFIFPKVNYYLAYNPVTVHSFPYTVITSTFVHYGFFHIIFNLFTLYYIGVELQQQIGVRRVASIFFTSGVGASAFAGLHILFDNTAITTFTGGASGVIFGFLGAVFVLQKRAGITTTPMIVLILLNLSMGLLMPNVSFMGHAGGLVFGTLTAYLLTRNKLYYSKTLSNLMTIAICLVGVGVSFIAYMPV